VININYNAVGMQVLGKTDASIVDLSVTEVEYINPETTTPFSNYGANCEATRQERTDNNATIEVTNLGSATQYGRSSDPAIAEIDNGGNVTLVSGGAVDLYVGASGLGEKRVTRTMAPVGGAISLDVAEFAPGSLAAHIQAQTDALIAGLSTGDTAQNIWTSNNYNLDTPAAVRNPNMFAAGLDLSGVCAIREGGSDAFPLQLVSNRHGLIAAHASGWVVAGARVVFLRSDLTFQTATVVRETQVSRNGNTADLSVVYLDSEITGCKVYKTLPVGAMETYLRSTVDRTPAEALGATVYGAVPMLRKAAHNLVGGGAHYMQINHLRRAGISTGTYEGDQNGIGYLTNSNDESQTPYTVMATTKDWGIDVISGDSAGPSWFVINEELILLSSQYSTSNTADISYWTPEINTIMNTLAGVAQGTYALEHPDLSEFAQYS
jgi:hypothetical protein